MRTRWRNRTGWSKAVVVFAVLLLVSLGLCGANYVAFTAGSFPIDGSSIPGQEHREQIGGLLIGAGLLELAGMVVGLVGLLVSLLGVALTADRKASKPYD